MLNSPSPLVLVENWTRARSSGLVYAIKTKLAVIRFMPYGSTLKPNSSGPGFEHPQSIADPTKMWRPGSKNALQMSDASSVGLHSTRRVGFPQCLALVQRSTLFIKDNRQEWCLGLDFTIDFCWSFHAIVLDSALKCLGSATPTKPPVV